MNSGTFHISAQEWRYYSREKSLIHTLHLSQLPVSRSGDPVFIVPVPPTGSTNGFRVPPLSLPPIGPYGGASIVNSINNFPPLWEDFQAGNTPPLQSGSYGNWTGTQSDLVNLKQTAAYMWPLSTGGVFLFYGMAVNTQNDFNLMDGLRTQLFTSTNAGIPSNVAAPGDHSNVIQDGQYNIRLIGTNWNNQMFIAEAVAGEHLQHSMIVDVPYGTKLGLYVQPPSVDPNTSSFSTYELLTFRLGP